MAIRYPLDKTGNNPSNLVENETHVLDEVFEYHRIIFTRQGGYYNHSLVVMQGTKQLQLNRDYQFALFWQDAMLETGFAVSSALQIINKNITGKITLRYQCVGGPFQDKYEGLTELVKTFPYDLRGVYFDDIINRPQAYPAIRHWHNVNDVFGLTHLVEAVDGIRLSLQRQSVLKLKAVYDRFLRLKQYVDVNLNNFEDMRRDMTNVLAKLREHGVLPPVSQPGSTAPSQDDGFVTKSVLKNEITTASDALSERIEALEHNRHNTFESDARDIISLIPSALGQAYLLKDNDSRTISLEQRTVFAPKVRLDFYNAGQWTVPDQLDGLVAKIVITVLARGNLHKEETYLTLKKGTQYTIDLGRVSTTNNPFGTEISGNTVAYFYHWAKVEGVCGLAISDSDTNPEYYGVLQDKNITVYPVATKENFTNSYPSQPVFDYALISIYV